MATQVTLKLKDNEGNVKNVQHDIEEIDLLQFESVMKVIKDIFVQVQEDPALKELFSDMFAEAQESEDNMDAKLLLNLLNSFETLAVHLPAKATQLLAVLSGIKVETLQRQKLMKVMDIYDEVVAVNDIQGLYERGKKSLIATKTKLTFLNLRNKATRKPAKKQA